MKITHLLWMDKFVSWLQSWKLYSNRHSKSCFSNEAFIACLHTVKTVLFMIPDRLHHNNQNRVGLGSA